MLLFRMKSQWRLVLPRGTGVNTVPLARSLSSNKSSPKTSTTRNIALVAWTALCGVLGAKFALHDSGEQEAGAPSTPSPQQGSQNGSTSDTASASKSGDSLLDSGPPQPPLPSNIFDAAIVGGGVVGLAVARELAVSFPNQRFILLEKSPDLVAGASSGNSGLGCTGYDAPSGSLERQLLRRSAQRHPNLYRSLGLSFEHARKCGALVVAWDKEQLAKLPEVHAANHDAGDTECRILTAAQLLELEPALGLGGPSKKKVLPLGGVLVPREVISEPWIVPIAYAESARLNGCIIRPGAELVALTVMRNSDARAIRAVEAQRAGDKDAVAAIVAVDAADDSEDDWFWTLTVQESGGGDGKQVLGTVGARVVINCAGLFGDEVEAMRSEAAVYAARGGKLSVDQATAVAAAGESTQKSSSGHEHRYFNIRPRKGQFVVLDAPPGRDAPALQHIIEPVPSQFTKGVIVWTTLYGQVVVGPTAEEQESRTDRQNTPEVIEALKAHGRVVLGDEFMDAARVAGTYSGIRPATEHRDYQIWSDDTARWVCVAGIRSTGLTGSSGIAEYVRCLYDHGDFSSLTSPEAGQPRTAEKRGQSQCTCLACTINSLSVHPPYEPLAKDEVVPASATPNPPMPSLDELRASFQTRQDGCVEVNGHVYRVTHPQCAFGMATAPADNGE